jgi:hypothetical protein
MKPDPMYPLIAEVANLCRQLLDLPVDDEICDRVLSDPYKLENARLKMEELLLASQQSKHYKLPSHHAASVRAMLNACQLKLCSIFEPEETQRTSLSQEARAAGERLTIYLRENGREDLCWIVVTILSNEDVNVRQVYGTRIMKAMNGDLKVASLLDRIIP